MNRQDAQDSWYSTGKERWSGCREEWSDEDWWGRSHEKGGARVGGVGGDGKRDETGIKWAARSGEGEAKERVSASLLHFNISPAILHRISLSCNLPYFSLYSFQPTSPSPPHRSPPPPLSLSRGDCVAWSPRSVVRHVVAANFYGFAVLLLTRRNIYESKRSLRFSGNTKIRLIKFNLTLRPKILECLTAKDFGTRAGTRVTSGIRMPETFCWF